MENLFVQIVGSFKQLVLIADKPLPDNLVLRAGDHQFAVADSDAPGLHKNIHAWRLDSDPGWKQGQTIPVSLAWNEGFQTQQAETLVGPDPVDLPDGTSIEGTLSPGDNVEGELTSQRQFKTYKLAVEPGQRFRIDMKGAATGDGTLPDPWISGIKGAFHTGGGVEIQPVWYDELGRTSTQIVWPSGQVIHLDQYGRVYTEYTNGEGDTVLRPPMGANDDGGEGFNARLFLSNFPGREYLIVVSGAPNPSDTGTFALSLTDMGQDDYPDGAEWAGALEVGGAIMGEVEVPGDVDWFEVELVANTQYTLEIKGSATDEGTLDMPRLAGIFDCCETLIEGTPNYIGDSRGRSNTTLDFIPQDDGIYYIAVSGLSPYLPNRSSIPVGTYTVSINVAS